MLPTNKLFLACLGFSESQTPGIEGEAWIQAWSRIPNWGSVLWRLLFGMTVQDAFFQTQVKCAVSQAAATAADYRARTPPHVGLATALTNKPRLIPQTHVCFFSQKIPPHK